MKAILLVISLLLVAYLAFVKLSELKCAGIAHAGGAAYSFSAFRGCTLQKERLT